MKFTESQYRLQLITHRNTYISDVELAEMALDGGCRWIQLRMKNSPLKDIIDNAMEIKQLCHDVGAVFILNDDVQLCKEIGADGVHVGQHDMSVEKARKILGDQYIIGATCNTFNDIKKVYKIADYVGLGPFRYTTTKQNLSPVIGLEGYKAICCQCNENQINIPITAIGGITSRDVADILQAGIRSVAVSGEILNAKDSQKKVEEIIDILEKNKKI